MKKYGFLLLTACFLISAVTSRKALTSSSNKDNIKVRTPRVDATSTTTCLVKTDSFYFCYVMTGPFATVGWESTQMFSTIPSTTTKYWSLKFKPYVESTVFIQQQIYI